MAPTPRRVVRFSLDAGIPEDKLRSEPTMLEAARAAVALAS